jgi:hypothetical protein
MHIKNLENSKTEELVSGNYDINLINMECQTIVSLNIEEQHKICDLPGDRVPRNFPPRCKLTEENSAVELSL